MKQSLFRRQSFLDVSYFNVKRSERTRLFLVFFSLLIQLKIISRMAGDSKPNASSQPPPRPPLRRPRRLDAVVVEGVRAAPVLQFVPHPTAKKWSWNMHLSR